LLVWENRDQVLSKGLILWAALEHI